MAKNIAPTDKSNMDSVASDVLRYAERARTTAHETNPDMLKHPGTNVEQCAIAKLANGREK